MQRYPLSGNHTAGERKSTQCILCHQCEETTAHFLLHCSALYQARHLYLPRILDSLRRYRISADPPNLVLILLDTNHLPSDVSSNDRAAHETLSRDLLFKLHSTRSILLGGTSAYQRALQLWNMRVDCLYIFYILTAHWIYTVNMWKLNISPTSKAGNTGKKKYNLELLRTPSSIWLWFELTASRSWQFI